MDISFMIVVSLTQLTMVSFFLTEPKDVRSTNATGSTVDVCWSRPEFGQVLGYIVKYREVETPHGAPAFLNVTAIDGDLSRCTALVNLKPWTDYEYRVYGWNRFETGQGSTVGRFGTRPDCEYLFLYFLHGLTF